MFKVYLIIALVFASFFAGWKVHGWREGDKEKEIVIKEVEYFNEQTIVDNDRLLIAEIELEDYKQRVKQLEKKSYAINKGICHSGDSHDSFISVYNQAIQEANSASP